MIFLFAVVFLTSGLLWKRVLDRIGLTLINEPLHHERLLCSRPCPRDIKCYHHRKQDASSSVHNDYSVGIFGSTRVEVVVV